MLNYMTAACDVTLKQPVMNKSSISVCQSSLKLYTSLKSYHFDLSMVECQQSHVATTLVSRLSCYLAHVGDINIHYTFPLLCAL